MGYSTDIIEKIENRFLSLSPEEKTAVITHGAAVCFSDLNKRLFLAENKIRFFEEKYGKTLSELDEQGLPDNAGFEMHEDYILWNHWTEVAQTAAKQFQSFQKITDYGVYR